MRKNPKLNKIKIKKMKFAKRKKFKINNKSILNEKRVIEEKMRMAESELKLIRVTEGKIKEE